MVIWNSLMASLHHLAAFTLAACLVYEFVSFRKAMTADDVRRIQRADMWYGISSIVLLVAGLLRVFFFEKGAVFYGANPMFWTKMALFTLVGLLSIYPTVRYIRWGKLSEGAVFEVPDEEHTRIRLMLNLEIVGLVLILFAAPAMARGIGL